MSHHWSVCPTELEERDNTTVGASDNGGSRKRKNRRTFTSENGHYLHWVAGNTENTLRRRRKIICTRRKLISGPCVGRIVFIFPQTEFVSITVDESPPHISPIPINGTLWRRRPYKKFSRHFWAKWEIRVITKLFGWKLEIKEIEAKVNRWMLGAKDVNCCDCTTIFVRLLLRIAG